MLVNQVGDMYENDVKILYPLLCIYFYGNFGNEFSGLCRAL